MAYYTIVGYRRAADGLPGSWTPDIPEGVPFTSICGDTTNTVAHLRVSTEADPGRLAVVRTEGAVDGIEVGSDIDGPLAEGGRFLIESAIGEALPADVTVRRALAALIASWDDDDDDKPNALRGPARLGPDILER